MMEEVVQVEVQVGTKLLYYSPLWLASNMARYSHDNHNLSDTFDAIVCNTCNHVHEANYDNLLGCDKCTSGPETDGDWWYRYEKHVGPKDKDLIYRIGIKKDHNTILRPITYDFHVEFSSKDLLAFSKHSIGNDFVMTSTRYTTIKKLKKERSFAYYTGSGKDDVYVSDEAWERSKHYIKHLENNDINFNNILILEQVRIAILKGNVSNDEVSTMLPQAWIYRGQIHINALALRHLFKLRSEESKAHVWMKEFVRDLYNEIPKDHKFLYEDIME